MGNLHCFETLDSVYPGDYSTGETSLSTNEDYTIAASVIDVPSAVVPRHQYSMDLSTSSFTFTGEEPGGRKGRYLFNSYSLVDD